MHRANSALPYTAHHSQIPVFLPKICLHCPVLQSRDLPTTAVSNSALSVFTVLNSHPVRPSYGDLSGTRREEPNGLQQWWDLTIAYLQGWAAAPCHPVGREALPLVALLGHGEDNVGPCGVSDEGGGRGALDEGAPLLAKNKLRAVGLARRLRLLLLHQHGFLWHWAWVRSVHLASALRRAELLRLATGLLCTLATQETILTLDLGAKHSWLGGKGRSFSRGCWGWLGLLGALLLLQLQPKHLHQLLLLFQHAGEFLNLLILLLQHLVFVPNFCISAVTSTTPLWLVCHIYAAGRGLGAFFLHQELHWRCLQGELGQRWSHHFSKGISSARVFIPCTHLRALRRSWRNRRSWACAPKLHHAATSNCGHNYFCWCNASGDQGWPCAQPGSWEGHHYLSSFREDGCCAGLGSGGHLAGCTVLLLVSSETLNQVRLCARDRQGPQL